MSKGADALFRAVAAARATRGGREAACVRPEMLQRIAFILMQVCATRLKRRRARIAAATAAWSAAMASVWGQEFPEEGRVTKRERRETMLEHRFLHLLHACHASLVLRLLVVPACSHCCLTCLVLSSAFSSLRKAPPLRWQCLLAID